MGGAMNIIKLIRLKLYSILFWGVLLIGIGLRFWQLGGIPESLYWDEVAMLVDAKSVATTGHDMHGRPWFQVMYPSYGDYKLPLYIWSASASVKLFGATQWAVRFPNAVAGLATMLVGVAVATQLWQSDPKLTTSNSNQHFKRWLQLSVLGVLAISPWSVLFSRTAFEGFLGQVLLGVSFLLVITSHRRTAWLVASALVGAVATYAYFSVRFVWPVVYLLGWWLSSTHKTSASIGRQVLSGIVLPFILFGLVLLPMFRSELYQPSTQFRLSTQSVLNSTDWPVVSNQLRELAGNTKIDRAFFHRHLLTLLALAENYADHMSLNFIFLHGDSNLRHGTGNHGLFLVWFVPAFLIGWWWLAGKRPKVAVTLCIWWIVALLPASVPENTPHALRSLNALLPLSIVIGWGTAVLTRQLIEKRQLLFTALSVMLLGLNLLQTYHFYFFVYPKLSAPDWQAGYREIAATVEAYQDQVDEVWVSRVDDRWYLWYMAFGSTEMTQFQQLQSQGYQFQAYQNVHWTPLEWSQVTPQSKSWLIIEPKESLEQHLADYKLSPNDQFEVYFPYHAVVFRP